MPCGTGPRFGAVSEPVGVIAASCTVQRDYGDAGGDVANRRKLNAALDMFYALALLHSLFVMYWFRLRVSLDWAVWEVAAVTSEQCGGEEWSSTLVNMYRLETRRKFSKDGELPGNWNFVTYGVQLLQSASAAGEDYDHGWGARMLDKLISGKDKSVRKKLLSSRLSILNLMDMIIGRCLVGDGDGEAPAGDMENRERAATIIAHLASLLHLTSFPGILQCICSLLESTSSCVPESHARPSGNPRVACPSVCLTAKKITTLTKWMKWVLFNPITNPGIAKADLLQQELRKYSKPKNRSPYKSRGAKELVSQGLLILERLTQDQRNCTEISKDQGLLSKITSPLTSSSADHGDLLTRLSADNTTTVEMLSRSLTVLSRVLTSPGDDTARLRQKLATNTQAVSNLLGILEGGSEGAQKLHGQALEILLTELALDGSLEEVDFHKLLKALLQRIFLEEEASSNVTEQWTNNNATSQVEIEHEQAGTETAATRLRGNAGEALARLLPVHAARGILSKQEATSLLNKVNRNLFAHLSSLQFPRCHLSC